MFLDETFRVKVGLAEMLKGGVIMDVTNAEQARIAENAGACAVMALERVPSDIRKEGGVARMEDVGRGTIEGVSPGDRGEEGLVGRASQALTRRPPLPRGERGRSEMRGRPGEHLAG